MTTQRSVAMMTHRASVVTGPSARCGTQRCDPPGYQRPARTFVLSVRGIRPVSIFRGYDPLGDSSCLRFEPRGFAMTENGLFGVVCIGLGVSCAAVKTNTPPPPVGLSDTAPTADLTIAPAELMTPQNTAGGQRYSGEAQHATAIHRTRVT